MTVSFTLWATYRFSLLELFRFLLTTRLAPGDFKTIKRSADCPLICFVNICNIAKRFTFFMIKLYELILGPVNH